MSLRYEVEDRYGWLAASLLHHPRLRHGFSAVVTINVQYQIIYLREKHHCPVYFT